MRKKTPRVLTPRGVKKLSIDGCFFNFDAFKAMAFALFSTIRAFCAAVISFGGILSLGRLDCNQALASFVWLDFLLCHFVLRVGDPDRS
jgi:hypothetical protein